MADIYRLEIDAQKKQCYTCKKDNNCKVKTLEEAGECNYSMKPEVKKTISKIKRL